MEEIAKFVLIFGSSCKSNISLSFVSIAPQLMFSYNIELGELE